MARLAKGQDFSVYSSPNFKFWFDEKYYTVQGAETMARMGTKDDFATMRAEYTRMRDTAQKRVARLQKLFPDSVGAKHKYDTGKKDSEGNPIYKSGFPTLKTIDPRDFPKAFSDLAKFLRAKGSTVTGQYQIKEKTIKTWQDQGLNLNQKNYNKVITILEEMRRQKIVYGSDKAVELADAMMGLDDQQTNAWLDHLDILLQHTDELQEIPDLAGYDFDEIMELLGD